MRNNSRRDFIKKTATLSLGALVAPSLISSAFSSTNKHALLLEENNQLFTLPQLEYGYDALEPHIDKLTMEIHHSKHHQGYVNNLNKALESFDKTLLNNDVSLSTIFRNIDKVPQSIRNNAGGHYNHSLFWSLMSPTSGKEPKQMLKSAINKSFSTFTDFKNQFTREALSVFGSGWVWLVINDGKLIITSTPNQDNPLMQTGSIKIKGTPILALDVWEHAYYLKNQNKRAEYIGSWWEVVNWDTCEDIYTLSLEN